MIKRGIKTFKYFLNYKDIMGSPWKALSDDSRREMLALLKKRDMIPTEIAVHFNFTLPAFSSHQCIMKDAFPRLFIMAITRLTCMAVYSLFSYTKGHLVLPI
jgi:hypothetical protein